MNNEEKKKLIVDFINGPLKRYLFDEVSFGRFKELINEQFGTDFCYSDLYPSFLFNARIKYDNYEEEFISDLQDKQDPYDMVNDECFSVIPNTFIACGENGNYCSQRCWDIAKAAQQQKE